MFKKTMMGHLTLSFKKEEKTLLKEQITSKEIYLPTELIEGRLKIKYDKPITYRVPDSWKNFLEGDGTPKPVDVIVQKPQGDFVHFFKNGRGDMNAYLSSSAAKKLFGYDVSHMSIKLWLELTDDYILISKDPIQGGN